MTSNVFLAGPYGQYPKMIQNWVLNDNGLVMNLTENGVP